MSAIGATGLQLYSFGQTVSMVFFDSNTEYPPTSWYDRIRENRSLGLHTLVLLDIKVKEQSIENLVRGRKIFEPPRFMTVGRCARQMIYVEKMIKDGVCGKDCLAVGAARVGCADEKFVAGTLEELMKADKVLGTKPLHSLVLIGTGKHELERDYVREFAIDKDRWDEIWARDYAPKPPTKEARSEEITSEI